MSEGREGSSEGFKLKCSCLRKGITGPRSGKLRRMTEMKTTTVFQIKLYGFLPAICGLQLELSEGFCI